MQTAIAYAKEIFRYQIQQAIQRKQPIRKHIKQPAAAIFSKEISNFTDDMLTSKEKAICDRATD
ncbi:MAG: hypothetical protein ACOYK8_06390 [Alphaproteobacteria bacterium]